MQDASGRYDTGAAMSGLIWEIRNWLKWRRHLRVSETHRQVKGVLERTPEYHEACCGRWVIDEVAPVAMSDSVADQPLFEAAVQSSDAVRQRLADGRTLWVVQVRNNNRKRLQCYPSARGQGFRFYVDLEAKGLVAVSCDPWFT